MVKVAAVSFISLAFVLGVASGGGAEEQGRTAKVESGTMKFGTAQPSRGAHVSSLRRLNKLGVSLGRRWAVRLCRKFYDNKWKYGYAKRVTLTRRLSRTRLRFRYEFNHRYFGYVTVWRTKPGSGYSYLVETYSPDDYYSRE